MLNNCFVQLYTPWRCASEAGHMKDLTYHSNITILTKSVFLSVDVVVIDYGNWYLAKA